MTSPPYYGLRSYGIPPLVWDGDPLCDHKWGEIGRSHHPGQVPDSKAVHHENAIGQTSGSGQFCQCGAWLGDLGLEPTPDLYVEHLVAIFHEARHVLRDDGTFWLNIADSYARDSHKGQHKPGDSGKQAYLYDRGGGRASACVALGELKAKDLIGIPWMLAFALRADGWYLRSDIIWHKPNTMPESVRDRCTKSHEYIFLLTKKGKYFFDHEAIKVPAKNAGTNVSLGKKSFSKGQAAGAGVAPSGNGLSETYTVKDRKNLRDVWSIDEDEYEQFLRWKEMNDSNNLTDVWHITTKPFKGAHFATMPPDLVETCILAGTSAKGVCLACNAPWVRETERESAPEEVMTNRAAPTDGLIRSGQRVGGKMFGSGQKLQDWRNEHPTKTLGWSPSCHCPVADSISATVLDPFGGSGTTALVANRLGRNAILIEIKPDYAKLAYDRLVGEGVRILFRYVTPHYK